MKRKVKAFGRGVKNFFNPRSGKAWSKGLKTASLVMVIILVVVLALSWTVLRSEKIVVVEVEDETCQEDLSACQKQRSKDQEVIAALQQEVINLNTPPTITVEKWVKTAGVCSWQKEISAERGDWLEMRIVVNVTKTMNHVLVIDASLADDPWIRVEDLELNGESFSGDITTGISLGSLTDTSQEITFRALLSNSRSRYSCGVNVLENTAEAGDCCEFQTTASVQVTVDITCSSCCRPKPDPCPDGGCPDPEPPPPPPEKDDGPAPRPDPDK